MLKAANGQGIDALPPLVQNYLVNDVDLERLKIQLPLVHDMMKTASSETLSIPVTKVTNVRTIAEAMNTSNVTKQC